MNDLIWNVLQVSVTTSLLIVPVFICCKILRRRYPARMLCLLWLILGLRLLIPIQITFPDAPVLTPTAAVHSELPPNTIEAVPTEIQQVDTQTNALSEHQPMPIVHHPQQKKFNLSAVFSVIWLSGAVLWLGFSLSSYLVFLRRMRKTAWCVQDRTLCALYEQEKVRLQIRKRIALLQSDEIDSPMIAGFFLPMLLLPNREIASADARLMIRHELTHYQHGDLYRKLIFLLAKCMHWFNPVIHLFAWQGAQDLEIACDQTVIQGLDMEGKRQYGQCILTYAARASHTSIFTTQFSGGKRAMKTRLQALFSAPKKRSGMIFLLMVLFAGGIIGGSFAVGAERKPDAETIQQMDMLAQAWCDAQKNQLTVTQAKSLLGGALQERFDAMVQDYGDAASDTRFSLDTLPMAAKADTVSYTLNPKAYTAQVQVHTNDTPYGGMTQIQTIQFGRQEEGLRVVGRTIDEAMLLDHPEKICRTAQDVLNYGIPENWVDADTPEEAVYRNIPLAGGRYQDANEKPILTYQFADGTAVSFKLAKNEEDRYHCEGIAGTSGVPLEQSDQEIMQAANQWAEGYHHKNAAFSYPVMSKEMQQEFIRQQEAAYGLSWFWRIGWGSSPSVGDWIVQKETDRSVLVTYRLYAGGEEFRYTERLTFGTEDKRSVVTGCEVLGNGVENQAVSRQEFQALYAPSEFAALQPPRFDDRLMQEWKENDPNRYAALLTPEGALKAGILMLHQDAYTIKRVSEETPAQNGVTVDLSITFPDSEKPIFVTMYGKKNGEAVLWEIGRFIV